MVFCLARWTIAFDCEKKSLRKRFIVKIPALCQWLCCQKDHDEDQKISVQPEWLTKIWFEYWMHKWMRDFSLKSSIYSNLSCSEERRALVKSSIVKAIKCKKYLKTSLHHPCGEPRIKKNNQHDSLDLKKFRGKLSDLDFSMSEKQCGSSLLSETFVQRQIIFLEEFWFPIKQGKRARFP